MAGGEAPEKLKHFTSIPIMNCLFLPVLFCGVFLATPSDLWGLKSEKLKNLKKLHVFGQKIAQVAGLVKKDEPEDCHVYYEDRTSPHSSTTYEQICEDEYKDECSTDYTTKAKEEILKQGTAPWELPEAKTETKKELKQGMAPWKLPEAKTEAEEELKQGTAPWELPKAKTEAEEELK